MGGYAHDFEFEIGIPDNDFTVVGSDRKRKAVIGESGRVDVDALALGKQPAPRARVPKGKGAVIAGRDQETTVWGVR